MSVAPSIRVCEVSPRDGLQNESAILPTQAKVALIEALTDAGLRHIEVTSFVHPKWVPQLADSGEVVAGIHRLPEVTYSGLCPNRTGLKRARRAGLTHVAIFLSASETHNLKNLRRPVAESLKEYGELFADGAMDGLRVRGYISTVLGCPYEGHIEPSRVAELSATLLEMGCEEVSLGDTTGIGTPKSVRTLLETLREHISLDAVALHFHDTRGLALANAIAGFEQGIRSFDASVAGLGGCPFAPGAAGNLATEDLVWAMERMGVRTGVDEGKLWRAGQLAARLVGRPLPGKVHLAGL